MAAAQAIWGDLGYVPLEPKEAFLAWNNRRLEKERGVDARQVSLQPLVRLGRGDSSASAEGPGPSGK
eukprot:13437686-Alexandrium_andersonii.AAC.1